MQDIGFSEKEGTSKVQNERITEIKGTQNAVYLLNDNSAFFLTGFKVLQNQDKGDFVRCARLMQNGKIKLIYFTSEYKSLNALIPSLDADKFILFFANMLSNILYIKGNGFLHCQNIDLSFDKIFVDSNTMSVHLIYLPLSIPDSSVDYAAFENNLRSSFIRLIHATPCIASRAVLDIANELASGTADIESLHKFVCSRSGGAGASAVSGFTNPARGSGSQPVLELVGQNTPIRVVLHVDKPEYIIGKNLSVVDGALTFNNAISRVHCKIIYQNSDYFVMDLGSANGTYLNGMKINENQRTKMHDGDILKLANSEFIIHY